MKYLLILLLFVSCSRTQETISITETKSKELFTSTQQYEIACWTIKKSLKRTLDVEDRIKHLLIIKCIYYTQYDNTNKIVNKLA